MINIRDKIAIIGFGASGFGTYLGLKEKGFQNIYIYNFKTLKKKNEVNDWNIKNLKNNYRSLKKQLGYRTVNSKTYFGNVLEQIKIGKYKIYENQIGGGLLNFWGGVLQKFDDQTLKSCLNINDLNDYYSKVSNYISISQVVHKKSNQNIYTNQQNIKCNEYVEELCENIAYNSTDLIENDTILAVSQNQVKDCHCFIGCLKHKHFKTSNLNLENNIKVINEIVEKIDFDKKKVITNHSTQIFDKIFLNTGPYNDQKILIQSSANNQNSIKIKDSTSFTFPIFYKGKLKKHEIDYNLTNCLYCIKDKNQILGHAQIYPPIDHINKSVFPSFLWNKFNFSKDYSTNRLLWARCYLSDEYSLIKDSKNFNKIDSSKNNKIKIAQKKFFEIFKKNLKDNNFFPIKFLINSKTSSHYAGDNDHVVKNILKQSEVHYEKRIFFNDSLLWKVLPSQSPTFTIMANAFRNTDIYL